MPKELRRYPRTSTSLDVIYYTEEGPTEEERCHHFATIVDISKGGARLLTDYKHMPNDCVWLHGLRHLAGKVPGRVRWIKRDQKKFNVGVQFVIAHPVASVDRPELSGSAAMR